MQGESIYGSKIEVNFASNSNRTVTEILRRRMKASCVQEPPRLPRPIRAKKESPCRSRTADKVSDSADGSSTETEQVAARQSYYRPSERTEQVHDNDDNPGNPQKPNTKTFLVLQQQLFQDEQQYKLNKEKDGTSVQEMPFLRPQEVPRPASAPTLGDMTFHGSGYVKRSPSPMMMMNRQNSDSYVQSYRVAPRPILSASYDGGSQTSLCSLGEPFVELLVSNLDYNISAREWKKILWSTFAQQITVLGVHIQTQMDNNNVGLIRVPSLDEARYAISIFHRKKIGYKRIHVTVRENDSRVASTIKSEIIALLKEVPGQALPLFKFVEVFEKRYHRAISVSELFKLKDVVEIQDQDGPGRRVKLLPGLLHSPTLQDPEDAEVQEIFEVPVCEIHCGNQNYVDMLDAVVLPNVVLSLRSFAPHVHTLLQTHNGSLPLISFPQCYETEFGPLPMLEQDGVPLEHLISCVPGVQIKLSKSGIKKVHWAENKSACDADDDRPCPSLVMGQQLNQFSREVVDLLKMSPHSQIPFMKFIPAYHHHFGRQCRVADYGYTKLMELFEAVPHVLQVMGFGQRVVLTLTHRVQVRRFTADLLRVLKAQPTKSIPVHEFADAYSKYVLKPFDIVDYGVCFLEDMLVELPETTVTVCGLGEEMIITIPRRDQTEEEMERTRQFALEVVDLLKHSPQCDMPFNKFIPAYHHHFGKQCKVSDYGFTKLLELFEAIPDTVEIVEEPGDDKIIRLTEKELLKVLSQQMVEMLRSEHSQCIPLAQLGSKFMSCHGHALRLEDYKVESSTELLGKLKHIVKVEMNDGIEWVTLANRAPMSQQAYRVLLLLMDHNRGTMTCSDLWDTYKTTFNTSLNVDTALKELKYYIEVTGEGNRRVVKLQPLQMFAREVRLLLRSNQGKIGLQQFESAYEGQFMVQLKPVRYGFASLMALLQAIPHVATIRGKGYRKTVLLSQDFIGKLSQYIPPSQIQGLDGSTAGRSNQDGKSASPSYDSGITDDEDKDLMHLAVSRGTSPVDFLADPVPSSVPSPDLKPSSTSLDEKDLIVLDGAIKSYSMQKPQNLLEGVLGSLTADEKKGQKTPLCQTPVSSMLQFAAQYLPSSLPKPLPVIPHQSGSSMPPGQIIHRWQHWQDRTHPHQQEMQQQQLQQNEQQQEAEMIKHQHQLEQALHIQQLALQQMLKTPQKEKQQQEKTKSSAASLSANSTAEPAREMVAQGTPSRNAPSAVASPNSKSGSGGSEHSASPSSNRGTPKKCRIAARFNTPIKPPREA
ncbi:meiosis regulator and mRNA stability factor 1 isoform X2 [Lingula anatina]|nr:meiosis regulator and mRNA stability factor 1 isoform X2 [Lingula anatina]|eukprot:XP_013410407.1 meiosis regulator and mRNA stability factor 1 isoform X2 [Lingula anatina]